MIKAYRKLWGSRNGVTSGWITTAVLGLTAIIVPLALGLTFYAPDIPKLVLALIGGVVGGIILLSLRHFAVLAFPVIYLIVQNGLIQIMAVFLAVSVIIDRLKEGRLSFTVPFPILLTVLVILGINGAMHSINSSDGWYALRYTLLLPLVVF
ncbi:MAG: hypothetical protein P9M15_05880, partial [Candidatus Electryoneaceae bacterium]|nr:hypothetical protein [Candidatus Electryoneaceae bacterium]